MCEAYIQGRESYFNKDAGDARTTRYQAQKLVGQSEHSRLVPLTYYAHLSSCRSYQHNPG